MVRSHSGRRPLRSRWATASSPSQATIAAGPSQAPRKTDIASWKAVSRSLAAAIDGASGRRARIAWGRLSPPVSSAITMSSRFAVSEPPPQMIERTRSPIFLRRGCRSTSRWTRSGPIASIQATLPLIVEISPLWPSAQKGCARRQAVVVFVL